MAIKIESIEQMQKEMLQLLRNKAYSMMGDDDLDDLVPKQMATEEDMAEMSRKLEDATFKKKLVRIILRYIAMQYTPQRLSNIIYIFVS